MTRNRIRSAENRQRDKAEEAGRQQAELHFLQNGRPEPPEVRGKRQNKACAERWAELTGRYPSWFPYITLRPDGWWIINAEGSACDCGPYTGKSGRKDAMSDAAGMAEFAKYHDVSGFMSVDSPQN